MKDSSRDGRLCLVVQRGPEEKPEVYRFLLQCGCPFNLEVSCEVLNRLSIKQEALHLRETNVVSREHELVAQEGQPLWKSDAVKFKTRLFVFRRFELIWYLRWMR